MKLEVARRKVSPLYNYRLDKSALEAEVEPATKLAKRLMEQCGIAEQNCQPGREHRPERIPCVDWGHRLGQFGLELRHFSAAAAMPLWGNGEPVLTNLDTGASHVQINHTLVRVIVAKGQVLQTLNE
jgi:hypothetical protein